MSRNESKGVFTFLWGGLLWNLQVLRLGLGEIHDALWYFPFSFEHWSLGSLAGANGILGRVLEATSLALNDGHGWHMDQDFFVPLVWLDSAHVGEILPRKNDEFCEVILKTKNEEYVAFGEDDFVGFWTCNPTKKAWNQLFESRTRNVFWRCLFWGNIQ